MIEEIKIDRLEELIQEMMKKIRDTYPTESREGNPITFDNGAAAPLVKCITEIHGSQSGSGTPSPENVRPIVAYNQSTISLRGKNLVNDKNFTSGLPNTAIGSDINNIISSTRYCYYEFESPKTNCIVSAKSNDAELFVGYIIFGYKNGVLTYNSGQILPTKKYAVNMTDYDIVRVSIGAVNGKTVPLDLTGYGYLQVEEGSTATAYEPYTSTTHTATFSQSIYQGNADFVGSKATATWGYIASYNGETLPGEWISSMDEYAPGTTPTTGAQVAYELASPTEETITPTNLPIKSLSGYNHIESSTGDMEVTYITEEFEPLVPRS